MQPYVKVLLFIAWTLFWLFTGWACGWKDKQPEIYDIGYKDGSQHKKKRLF